ncbi:hypothetical protein BYT27DRAFT_7211551 [Phlegmacium glaucopus]|nr:hypothetical protein BYT27DRAFT_7211551 [Phlegmacium glaucopus]
MGKSTKNLKAALKSQQSRLKANQKLLHAAQVAEHKIRTQGQRSTTSNTASGPKGKAKQTIHPPKRPTIPFKSTDSVLLIGEGNFSFARALIQSPALELCLSPNNITATAYDSERECYEKYPEAKLIVSDLRSTGMEILFSVDGTCLEKNSSLKGRRWDRIVWNFPHAGKGITDQDRNILSNQLLVLDFLRSAANILKHGHIPSFSTSGKKKKLDDDDSEDDDKEITTGNTDLEDAFVDESITTRGTVLITLRNVVPYTQWDIPRLAKTPPLGTKAPNPQYILLRSFQFYRNIWTGYEHRMTKGERAHGTGTTGEGGEDRTWEFCLRHETI